MPKGIQSLALLFLVAQAGCTTEPRRPGLPIWDFERDEQMGRVIGSIIGFGGPSALFQDGLDLAPTELNRVILNALATNAVVPAPAKPSSNPIATTQWTISESHEGKIITDWKPITGRKAGVFWWEKTYDCEVHHVIMINQSHISHGLTNFTIVTEIRERPNKNYPWVSGDPELGRASFENIKNILLDAVREELFKTRAKK